MLAEVRNVLKKESLMAERDVVKQNKVLMDLAHVTHMRYHRKAEFASQQTHSEEFRNSCKPRAIGLDHLDSPSLHKVVEHNAIGDVLAQRDAGWGYSLRE